VAIHYLLIDSLALYSSFILVPDVVIEKDTNIYMTTNFITKMALALPIVVVAYGDRDAA
jgi:hypothetical protein